MRTAFVPPRASFHIVSFDCDSTLTSIEGVDELARLKGQLTQVADLTRRAMGGELALEEVFAQRLSLLRPSRADLHYVARAYAENLVPDAREVVAALLAAGCAVHVVSGGLLEAVRVLGRSLGLPASHIHAVPLEFDRLAGRWWRYGDQASGGNPDEAYLAVPPSPLARSHGKQDILRQLAAGETATMLVGDGVTDLEARAAVRLFVGFGGVVSRPTVEQQAEVFVRSPRLSAIVPLALSAERAARLRGTVHEEVLERGLQDLAGSMVTFRDKSTGKDQDTGGQAD